MNNRRVLLLVGFMAFGFVGCRRTTLVLSPQAKRLAVEKIPTKDIACEQEKAGITVQVGLLPADAIQAVFGTKHKLAGYAVTIQNYSKEIVELDRARIGLSLVPNAYVYRHLAAHVTVQESYFPLGPVFAVGGALSFPLWCALLKCVGCSGECAGFATLLLAWPLTVLVLGATYIVITVHDAYQTPAVTGVSEFLSTFVLDRVVVRPHMAKTRIFFTAQPSEVFAMNLKQQGIERPLPFIVHCPLHNH